MLSFRTPCYGFELWPLAFLAYHLLSNESYDLTPFQGPVTLLSL